MLGPPGSGKTCTQHLLLNEDPPIPLSDAENKLPTKSITDSTPIACRAVKATRISSNDGGKTLKRITRDELLNKLASNLKNEAEKQRKEMSSAPTQPSRASAGKSKQDDLQAITSKQELKDSATLKHEDEQVSLAASTGNVDKCTQEQADLTIFEILNLFVPPPKEEVKTSDVMQEIIDLIPKAKAQFTDEWVFIIDSGGQPAFQELLPMFTRAASLNVITLDISKPLDEECDYLYRINGQLFPCDKKFKYTNLKLFHSTILSGIIGQKLNLPCVVKHPEHSMFFVLGTHYDRLKRAYPEKLKVENYLVEMNKKLMSSLPSHVMNNYIIHKKLKKSIIFPVETLLPAKSEDRKNVSEELFDVILNSEVSLKINVPIRWFVFELQLEETAASKGFVTKEEAIEEGKRLHMSEDAVNEALQYLHNCTIILYYPEVRPQLVFVNPQKILDVLSHLLALTYVDEQTVSALVPKVEQKERIALMNGKLEEGILKKFKDFSEEFQPEYFINLLEHLHVIIKFSDSTYFLPCALPAHNPCSFQIPEAQMIKPLRLVWRIKENKLESKVILPVPRGIFHLVIVHLLRKQESTVICLNTSSGIEQFRDVVSLLISFTKGHEPTDNLYIINCKKYIEVRYDGSTEHCPKVRELVKTAISKSVEALRASCGDIDFAFACKKDNGQCCFVNEDDTTSTFCGGHKCALDDSYLCWFKMSIAKGNNNSGKLLNIITKSMCIAFLVTIETINLLLAQ